MSIAFITVPGKAQKNFAEELNKRTKGGVKLVVVQKHPKETFPMRLKRLRKRVGKSLLSELWYAFLIRINLRVRLALEYFRQHPPEKSDVVVPDESGEVGEFAALEAEVVNSDEVHEALKKISPDVLVVWGSSILEPHILATAKKAVNLHFGLCPFYRGAVANQHAVMKDDLSKIGATIHFIQDKADTGAILATIAADASKAPLELFRDLNDRAVEKYLDIVTALAEGKELQATPQDMMVGSNLLLKSWTPKVRYRLGKKIVKWEKGAKKN